MRSQRCCSLQVAHRQDGSGYLTAINFFACETLHALRKTTLQSRGPSSSGGSRDCGRGWINRRSSTPGGRPMLLNFREASRSSLTTSQSEVGGRKNTCRNSVASPGARSSGCEDNRGPLAKASCELIDGCQKRLASFRLWSVSGYYLRRVQAKRCAKSCCSRLSPMRTFPAALFPDHQRAPDQCGPNVVSLAHQPLSLRF